LADTTESSLLIAPQWIGDAVMTEPLVRLLAARGERVSVAALPWVAPVYQLMAGVGEVIALPFRHGALQWRERRALARELHGRFANAYVCPNSFKSALLPWLADIPSRRGYLGEQRRIVLNQRLPNPPAHTRPPMVAFYAALAQLGHADQEIGDAWRPRLAPDAPALDAALAQLLQRPELRALDIVAHASLVPESYVVFAPGAEYGPAKRWPAAHFADLALRLGRPVLLLGSAKDQAVCDEIVHLTEAHRPGRVLSLAGRTGLLEAFALIAHAHRMVGNDSGLMHVAAAFDVPQVAVFGSSSPEHTPPLSDAAQVVWLKRDADYTPALDCAPCFERTCRFGHTRCLRDVTPERVAGLL